MEGKERDYAWYLYKGIPVVIVGTYSNGNYDCEKFDGLKSLDVTARVSSFSIGDMSDIAVATNESVLEIADIEKKGIEITSSDVHPSYDDSLSGEYSKLGSTIMCKSVPDVNNKGEYINKFITDISYVHLLAEENAVEERKRLDYEVQIVKVKALNNGSYNLTKELMLITGKELLAEMIEYCNGDCEYSSTDINSSELYILTNDGYFVADDETIASCIL